MCPLLYQILNKLDFHIKQSYQTPKYLLNKYEMTIKNNTVVLETGRGTLPPFDQERSFFPLTSPLPTVVNSLIIWNCQKRSVHLKKIQTGTSLYCAGPNDHQVTSTFVKL